MAEATRRAKQSHQGVSLERIMNDHRQIRCAIIIIVIIMIIRQSIGKKRRGR